MTVFTKSFGREGVPEISIEVDDEFASEAQWLVGYFQHQLEDGVHFAEGQTVQVGYVILQLQAGVQCLEVWEPDFDAMPIRWRRGVNNTLRHLCLQKSVCELLECEPEYPSIRHAGVVSPCFFESDEFVMSRDVSVDSDSGWVFTEEGYAGDEGVFISLYQIVIGKINIVPFLALPEHAFVRFRPGKIEITLGGQIVTSDDDSLLQRLMTGPILI